MKEDIAQEEKDTKKETLIRNIAIGAGIAICIASVVIIKKVLRIKGEIVELGSKECIKRLKNYKSEDKVDKIVADLLLLRAYATDSTKETEDRLFDIFDSTYASMTEEEVEKAIESFTRIKEELKIAD